MGTFQKKKQFFLDFVHFRFIYVKYAHLLVKEGIRLLHWLTLIFITIFILHLGKAQKKMDLS